MSGLGPLTGLIRGLKRAAIAALAVAILGVFVYPPVATALQSLVSDGAVTLNSLSQSMIAELKQVVFGPAKYALAAVMSVAAVREFAQYIHWNLISQNFTPLIGVAVAGTGIVVAMELPSLPYGLPSEILAGLAAASGLYLTIWQS